MRRPTKFAVYATLAIAAALAAWYFLSMVVRVARVLVRDFAAFLNDFIAILYAWGEVWLLPTAMPIGVLAVVFIQRQRLWDWSQSATKYLSQLIVQLLCFFPKFAVYQFREVTGENRRRAEEAELRRQEEEKRESEAARKRQAQEQEEARRQEAREKDRHRLAEIKSRREQEEREAAAERARIEQENWEKERSALQAQFDALLSERMPKQVLKEHRSFLLNNPLPSDRSQYYEAVGPLQYYGHRAGSSRHLPPSKRRAIIRYTLQAELRDPLSTYFQDNWGAPFSQVRLREILNYLDRNVRKFSGRKGYDRAVADWQKDSDWTSDSFYELVEKFEKYDIPSSISGASN